MDTTAAQRFCLLIFFFFFFRERGLLESVGFTRRQYPVVCIITRRRFCSGGTRGLSLCSESQGCTYSLVKPLWCWQIVFFCARRVQAPCVLHGFLPRQRRFPTRLDPVHGIERSKLFKVIRLLIQNRSVYVLSQTDFLKGLQRKPVRRCGFIWGCYKLVAINCERGWFEFILQGREASFTIPSPCTLWFSHISLETLATRSDDKGREANFKFYHPLSPCHLWFSHMPLETLFRGAKMACYWLFLISLFGFWCHSDTA